MNSLASPSSSQVGERQTLFFISSLQAMRCEKLYSFILLIFLLTLILIFQTRCERGRTRR